MELRIGSVVRSRAGRDKNKLMAVVGTDGKMLLLCDGKEHRLEKPKRKNPLHVAPTKTVLEHSTLSTNRSLIRVRAELEEPTNLNSGR